MQSQEYEIVTVPDQLVLGLRRHGPYPIIKDLLMEIVHYGMEHGAVFSGPPMYLCHENSVEEVYAAQAAGNADVEVGFPIEKEITGPGPVRAYIVPGGTMIKAVHKGPYESSEPAYLALFSWMESKGHVITGPVREVYLNDPQEVPPEEILTEIYVPIQ